jgi:hypothetical protein
VFGKTWSRLRCHLRALPDGQNFLPKTDFREMSSQKIDSLWISKKNQHAA